MNKEIKVIVKAQNKLKPKKEYNIRINLKSFRLKRKRGFI